MRQEIILSVFVQSGKSQMITRDCSFVSIHYNVDLSEAACCIVRVY